MADIIKRHNFTYYLYVDNIELSVPFNLGSDDLFNSDLCKSSVELWVQEINNWMILNGVKLNKEKNSCFTLSA